MGRKPESAKTTAHVFRTPSIQVALLTTWKTAPEGTILTPEQIERLRPYITRYAQTLGVSVYAVGGFADHLHVFYDMAASKTIGAIEDELRKTSARYLRESLGAAGFEWGDTLTVSISPEQADEVSEYVIDNAARHQSGQIEPTWEFSGRDVETNDEDKLPEWLRQAIAKTDEKE